MVFAEGGGASLESSDQLQTLLEVNTNFSRKKVLMAFLPSFYATRLVRVIGHNQRSPGLVGLFFLYKFTPRSN